MIRTLYANIITSFGLVIFESMPDITRMLIVIYGGVILGVGVGIVVKSGGAIDGLKCWLYGLTGIIEFRLAHSY